MTQFEYELFLFYCKFYNVDKDILISIMAHETQLKEGEVGKIKKLEILNYIRRNKIHLIIPDDFVVNGFGYAGITYIHAMEAGYRGTAICLYNHVMSLLYAVIRLHMIKKQCKGSHFDIISIWELGLNCKILEDNFVSYINNEYIRDIYSLYMYLKNEDFAQVEELKEYINKHKKL